MPDLKLMNMKLHTLSFLVLLLAASVSAQVEVSFTMSDVIVYSQGIGLIIQSADLPAGNQYMTTLPEGVIEDSIRVTEEGASVLMTRTSRKVSSSATLGDQWTFQELLAPNLGAQVRISTYEGDYSGTLKWYDAISNTILLTDVTYSLRQGNAQIQNAQNLVIKQSNLESYVFPNLPELPEIRSQPAPQPQYMWGQQPTGAIDVSWLDTGDSPTKAGMTYMTSGLSWKPIFYLDLAESSPDSGKAGFSFLAKVENRIRSNLSSVNLKLVAGNINIASISGGSTGVGMHMEQRALSNIYESDEMSSVVPSISGIEEYAVFTFPNPQTIRAGESLILPVFEEVVEYVKDYVWDARSQTNWGGYQSYDSGEQEGKVKRIFRLTNPDKTWPYGIVSVFEGMMLTGQDGISWTPKGREAKVTVGSAPDIEVKRRQTSKVFYRDGNYNEDYNHTVTLSLKNYKIDPVEVLVIDTYPQRAHNLTANIAFEEKPGNMMHWKVKLEPGQTQKLIYGYWTD